MYKSQFYSKLSNLIVSVGAVAAFALQPTLAIWAGGQPLADPADSFVVTSPTPNSVVSGTVNSSFVVSDDEQTSISYEIRLYQPNCLTNIGLIAAGQVASGNQFSASWNSAGPIQYAPVINDGNYCQEVCVSLSNNGTIYSACNLRQLSIRNHNRAPVFTVTPTSPVTLNVGASWQFDLEASDADGDQVVFGLQSAPAFVSLVPATGVISVNGSSSVAGTHSVTVEARDGLGAVAQFGFTLQINSTSTPPATPPGTPPATPPSTPPSTPPTPPTNPPPANMPAVLQFLSPTAGAELKGSQNLVSWKATDREGVESLSLSYFLDGEKDQAQLLVNVVDLTKSEYVWDVTDIPPGEYHLWLTLEDKLGVVTTAESEIFQIVPTVPEDNNTTRPLIINPAPADLAEIRDLRPQISAKFSPPSDGQIATDTLIVTFDGNDITDLCEVTPDGFVCDLTADLALGEHTVKAEVQDDQDRVAEREWSFTILTAAGTAVVPPFWQTLTPQAWLLGLLVCCIAILLLLIPWWLFNLWRNRRDEESDTPPDDTSAVEVVPVTYTAPAAEYTVITPPPVYVDPNANQTTTSQLDPAAFPSYEDYFTAAAGTEPTNVTGNYVPAAAGEPYNYPPLETVNSEPEVFAIPEVDTTTTTTTTTTSDELTADSQAAFSASSASSPSSLAPLPATNITLADSNPPAPVPVVNNITINPPAQTVAVVPTDPNQDPLAPAQAPLAPAPAPASSDPYAAYGFGVDDNR